MMTNTCINEKKNFQKTNNSNIETKTNVRGWAENNAIIT